MIKFKSRRLRNYNNNLNNIMLYKSFLYYRILTPKFIKLNKKALKSITQVKNPEYFQRI